MKIQKIKFTGYLFVAFSLFLYGITVQTPFPCIIAIAIAYYVKTKGYNVLFKKYDEKNKEKLEKAKRIHLAMAAKIIKK